MALKKSKNRSPRELLEFSTSRKFLENKSANSWPQLCGPSDLHWLMDGVLGPGTLLGMSIFGQGDKTDNSCQEREDCCYFGDIVSCNQQCAQFVTIWCPKREILFFCWWVWKIKTRGGQKLKKNIFGIKICTAGKGKKKRKMQKKTLWGEML